MNDLENASPGASGSATQAGTESAAPGNVQPQGGEASGQGATAGESFIPKDVDLNTLPPQLRAHIEKVNKEMVRGFTEKTSKLSETTKSEVAKAVEAYKQKASFYDAFVQDQELVKYYNDYVQKISGQNGQQNLGDPALTQLKEQIEQVNQKLQIQELAQITEAFSEAVNEKGEKLHPDFNRFNDIVIGQVPGAEEQEEFSFLRACIELAPGGTPQEKLANGYKTAKATYDAIFEEGRKAGLGRVQAKVMNGTQPPSGSLPPSDVTMVDKKPKNAAEALAMARKRQLVSRE